MKTNHEGNMGKIYTIEVGVEYPLVDEDGLFEVEVEFTDKEIEKIIQGGIRLMHKDSMDIGTHEFIEVLSKTNSVLNKLFNMLSMWLNNQESLAKDVQTICRGSI